MGLFDAPKSTLKYVPFVVLFNTLVHIPIANVIARPGGLVSYTLRPLLDAFTKNDYQRIVVITLVYYFITYTGSTVLSFVAFVLANPDGYNNAEPRLGREKLTGLPLRLHSTHVHMIETFPSFATCVALTLALPLYIADPAQAMDKCINLLLLTAFCKTVLYIPAYVLGYPTTRSFIHLMNNGALLDLFISIIRVADVV